MTRRRSVGAWLGPLLLCGGMFGGAFGFYFLIYGVRHFSLPLGFDAPWYVWRTEFVASQGLGPLDTAARPGHELLSADLSSVTGLSGLELHVVLPYVLVGIFALAMGALLLDARTERWRWAIGAAVAAGLVGTTRLVGENVANLLNVLLVVAGLTLLIRFIRFRRGFTGAVLMLIAAGLAHWLFLGVFGVVMAVWFLFALPSSRVRVGTVWETESGALAAAGGIVGVVMAIVIYGVLGSSLSTFEIHEAKRRYLPKLREDLGALRLAFTGAAIALGGAALFAERRDEARRPFLRMLAAWTAVMAGGTMLAALTKALPPHRFWMLLVAVPFPAAVAAAIVWAARWILEHAGKGVAVTFAVVAVVAVAVPAGLAWYGDAGPQQFFDAAAYQQTREAAGYVAQLPSGKQVVFAVKPQGPFGPISTAEKERTIRAGMPPDRQEDVHVYPGSVRNLLAGRFTPVSNAEANGENRTYWRDVRAVLHRHPAILVLSAFSPSPRGFLYQIAPGVALIQGPRHVAVPAVGHVAVATTETGVLQAILLAALLGIAGLGWTAWFLGREPDPLTLISLAPAVGVGIVLLASLLTAKTGLALGGSAGVATFVVVALAGGALALLRWKLRTERADG